MTELTTCVCCESEELTTIVSLGKQPQMNTVEDHAQSMNLPVTFLMSCDVCDHVQIDRPADCCSHTDELSESVDPGATLLAGTADGPMSVTVDLLLDVVYGNRWWRICRDRVSYFSPCSLDALCQRVGVHVTSWEIAEDGHSANMEFTAGAGVNCAEFEAAKAIAPPGSALTLFGPAVSEMGLLAEAVRTSLKSQIEGQYVVVGYGMSQSCTTMLNFSDKIPLQAMVDDDEAKQGKVTPVRHLPISSLANMAQYEGPIAWVVLAWDHRDAIVQKIKDARPDSQDLLIELVPLQKIGSLWA